MSTKWVFANIERTAVSFDKIVRGEWYKISSGVFMGAYAVCMYDLELGEDVLVVVGDGYNSGGRRVDVITRRDVQTGSTARFTPLGDVTLTVKK